MIFFSHNSSVNLNLISFTDPHGKNLSNDLTNRYSPLGKVNQVRMTYLLADGREPVIQAAYFND